MPAGLNVLRLLGDFNARMSLPESLEEFHMSEEYDGNVTLPENIKVLTIGKNFNEKIILPPKLEKLILYSVLKTDIFPSSLKMIYVSVNIIKYCNFPRHLSQPGKTLHYI